MLRVTLRASITRLYEGKRLLAKSEREAPLEFMYGVKLEKIAVWKMG